MVMSVSEVVVLQRPLHQVCAKPLHSLFPDNVLETEHLPLVSAGVTKVIAGHLEFLGWREGKGRRGRMGWNECKHSSLSSVVTGVVTLRQVTAVVTSQSCFAVTLSTQCDTCTWM